MSGWRVLLWLAAAASGGLLWAVIRRPATRWIPSVQTDYRIHRQGPDGSDEYNTGLRIVWGHRSLWLLYTTGAPHRTRWRRRLLYAICFTGAVTAVWWLV